MIRKPSLLLLLASCLAVSPAWADKAGDSALYGAFRAMDERVVTIGYRLATRNTDLCANRENATGLVLSDIALYPAAKREAVAAAYSIPPAATAPIFVAAVAADSPAWQAGLRPGHVVAAIDDVALRDIAPAAQGDYGRMDAIERRWAGWLGDGTAEVTLAFGRDRRIVALASEPGCASIFQVTASRDFGAAADGRYVQVNAALVDFARVEEELAAVLAHELAHNILKHRERLDAAGIGRGLTQQFGRNARLTRLTETEADRLSVWLLDGAGYDPAAAIRFWTRRRQDSGPQIIASGTHGRTSTRIETIAAEIAAMRTAKKKDAQARPAYLAAIPLE